MFDILELNEPKKQLVPPSRDPNAPIILVGEASGADEVARMEPFVGRSGRLLTECMEKAGVPQRMVYKTTVIKERPPGNVIKPFFDKNHFTEAGRKYVEQLKIELENHPANVIVAVGNVALAALCGETRIAKFRGSIIESTLLPGRKVIPTIHPAAALRIYIQRFFIIHDLKKAKIQSEFSEVKLPQRNLIIDPTITDFELWFAEIQRLGIKRISFDIEITGQLELSCFALSYDPSEAICIPVSKYTFEHEARAMYLLNELISDPTIEIIGQNINFDFFFNLKKYNIHPKCQIQDTMIGHNVLYPDFPKGLDFLCSMYTNEPYYKDEGKEWKGVKDWPKFWQYNCKDAATTLEIWNIIERDLKAQGFWHTYRMDIEKHYPMFFPMLRGMNANPPAIDRVRDDLAKTIWDTQEELDATVKDTISNRELKQVDSFTKQEGFLNEGSPKQVMSYFYVDLGIPPYLSKGRPTCDDKALQRLAKGTAQRKPIKAAALIQQLRKYKKFRNTYLNMNFDEDSRFRCTYNPRGTIFGRLSSSQTIFHTGMNQQNLPPEFKHFLLADNGYFLWELDGVQAEWVATAFIANEARMMDVVNSGRDPHVATAEMLTGVNPDIIVTEDKRIGHTVDPDKIAGIRAQMILENPQLKDAFRRAKFLPRTFSFRQCGKKSNHGFNYGMGSDKFALTNETPNADAKLFHTHYHNAYPGLQLWYNRLQYELRKHGRVLTNPFGRKVRLLDRWGPDLFNQAYAFKPQSTIADQVRRAIDIIYREDLKQNKVVRPSELLGQVHDSILYQYPLSASIEQMALFIHTVKEAMELPIEYEGRTFCIRSEAKVGVNWGSWDKKTNVTGMKKVDISSVDSIIKGINDYR